MESRSERVWHRWGSGFSVRANRSPGHAPMATTNKRAEAVDSVRGVRAPSDGLEIDSQSSTQSREMAVAEPANRGMIINIAIDRIEL